LHSDSSTEFDPDPPRKIQKAQYVGSWDSKQGKMVYHLLGEGDNVLKPKKDPRDNTYFPQGAGATSVVGFSGHVSPKNGTNSSNVTPLLAKQSNKKTLELSPGSQKAVS
jgi:hypothetical protein